MSKTLFKVLLDGQSFHGGSLVWDLPKEGKPGEWQSVDGEVYLCHRGLHLTDWVACWWKPGAKAYVVEAEGVEGDCENKDRKCVARRVRLLREATEQELAEAGVFQSGTHLAKEARQFIASGSATVRASGSATVRASGSAAVRAWDSATVEASGSATVEASGSATVEASGSATVRASGSATVEAWGSATVRASGSATVRASGSATVISWWGSPAIKVEGLAVHVNRSGPAPVVFLADGELALKSLKKLGKKASP
jgi:hypothetical protein